MNYRDMLLELNAIEECGKSRFDSHFLAWKFSCKVAVASKWMYRLHRMNFVKRTRVKRSCISKRGNFCYKGYCYEYSLSRQGRQYVSYMKQIEPLELMKNSELADKAFQLMPEDSKKVVMNWTLIRQGSRYKGGNHNLQALGIIAGVFPDICRSFNDIKTANKKSEIENELSKVKIARLESRISCLEKENDLLRRAQEERQEVQISTQGLPQFLIKLASLIMKERKLSFDYAAMWELLYLTYKGFSRDLLQVLYIVLSSRMTSDEARKILDMIYNRNKEAFAMAEDYRGRVLRDCRQLQGPDISP